MTLFYTQPHAIRPYDRTFTENFNNIPPRSSPTSPEKSSSTEVISSQNPNDLPYIVAPYPKKALYAYTGNLLNNNCTPVLPSSESPWGLSAVQEDIEDDPIMFETNSDFHQSSSRPASQSTSPDRVHRSSPVTQFDQDEEDLSDESYSGAIEIDQIRKQRPTSRPIKLAIDNSHLIFGSSPITRAHNPLPLDSHFSPTKRHHHQSQPYPSRPTLHQANNIQRKLVDVVVGGNSFDDSTQILPSSKASKAAILLRISEGGRRRALSVGSASLKPGSKIPGRV
ncbi:7275_t:CDS:2 [Diversispora eburnea]|uniref:7275_t:CDS:1 n=1 Tax=Diversispora eburnea TaxID=1213867 RepID=A0A9N8YVB3_9GLOM|nr:7275_t:CDS:2 [Diversispora eburnea]